MAGEIDAGLNDPLSAFKGAANMNAMLQQLAKQQAGRHLAAGDQQGGVAALQSAGMLDEADSVNKSYLDAQERHQKLSTEQQAMHAKAAVDVADAMSRLIDEEGEDKALPAFDHLQPMFKQMGASDEDLQLWRGAIAQNPREFVSAFSQAAQKHLEQYTLSPGAKRYDQQGNIIADNPKGPEYKTVAPGGTLVKVGGEQAPAAPDAGGQPAAATPAMPYTPQAVKLTESGGNPFAVGPATVYGRARGDMQTMPTTLTDPGFGVKPAQVGADGKVSPQEMDRVGNDYLGALQQYYKEPITALAAYNWGPGKVDQWLKDGGDVSKLPSPVREYIGTVLMHQRMLEGKAQAGSSAQVVYQAPPNKPAAPELSDDALTTLSDKYLATGQMDAMGMNSAGLRTQILNRAAERAKELHMTGSGIAGMQAAFRANSKSLADITSRRAQIGAYEDTVQQSIGLVQQHIGALSDTGFQTLNKAGNWWKRETNDPAMAELDSALGTVVNEYAKVMSNATGGGVTSDAARNKAESMLNSANNKQALLGQISILTKEMGFRVQAMDRTISGLNSKVTNAIPAPQRQAAQDQGASTDLIHGQQPSAQDIVDELRKRGRVK